MKILVLDYVKSNGGGTVISDYILNQLKCDQNNKWIHITSRNPLDREKKLINFDFPWIKKSKIHRLIFEKFYLTKFIKRTNPDLIFSLQNIGVLNFKKQQILYVHQALPFTFNNLHAPIPIKDSVKMFILKKVMIKHIKKANFVIVQTNYMKNLIKKYNENIIVSTPKIYIDKRKSHIPTTNLIYPVNAQSYKRFDLVLKIARTFKSINQSFKIQLTLNGDENKNIIFFKRQVLNENLNIEFIGKKTVEDLECLYERNNLLFTSEVESLGLPILEAIHYNCKILAYDRPFVKELTCNYKDIYLFNEDNINETVIEFIKDINNIRNGDFPYTSNLLEDLKDLKIFD
ncbi:glycosyltransferase [Staphylococcus xylosus]|uniref:glycosyltransferase n=1 Tax=Staphylococcus xylosus TaxID=1288 RepID=UPI002DBB86B0|nr:glycosyltransferase [Staphylococcus xylosus]MEB8121489.1 glycosyltransferase [Staphylococcus xylosus]